MQPLTIAAPPVSTTGHDPAAVVNDQNHPATNARSNVEQVLKHLLKHLFSFFLRSSDQIRPAFRATIDGSEHQKTDGCILQRLDRSLI